MLKQNKIGIKYVLHSLKQNNLLPLQCNLPFNIIIHTYDYMTSTISVKKKSYSNN